MSLRQQIVAGFAVLLGPLAVVALVAFAVIGRLGGAVDAVLLENERTLEAAAEMDRALERLDSAALLVLLGRDGEAAEIARPARASFRSALGVAAGNLTVADEGQIVGAIEGGFADYERAYDALAAAEPEAARDAYADRLVPAFDRVRDGLERLTTANRAAASAAAREAGSMAQTARWAVGLGALVAVVLGAWAAARLSRQIAGSYAPGAAPPRPGG